MIEPADAIVCIREIYRGGSTSPALVELGDRSLWVAKFHGSGPGPRGLAVELIASRLAASCGLPVPAVRPLWLPANFPWQAGTDEFDDLIQRSAGWNLGVAFVEGARPLQVGDLAELPSDFLDRLAAVDALLANFDRTPRNPNLLRAGNDALWAIDHDACLFIGRAIAGRRAAPVLPENHFLHGRPIDLPATGARPIAEAIAAVPDEWCAAWGTTRDDLAARLIDHLAPRL